MVVKIALPNCDAVQYVHTSLAAGVRRHSWVSFGWSCWRSRLHLLHSMRTIARACVQPSSVATRPVCSTLLQMPLMYTYAVTRYRHSLRLLLCRRKACVWMDGEALRCTINDLTLRYLKVANEIYKPQGLQGSRGYRIHVVLCSGMGRSRSFSVPQGRSSNSQSRCVIHAVEATYVGSSSCG